MAKDLIPSRYYYVKSTNSLKSCLALMKAKNLSFLLVENQLGRLVGIFTLKDLLKHCMVLKSGANMEKPVRSYMSRPVISVPAHKIHQAAQIMMEKGIRHLAVTSDRKGEQHKVIGVVDMEALVQHMLDENKMVGMISKEIAVYSSNGALLRLLKNALKGHALIKVDKVWSSKLTSDSQFEALAHQYDLFFFDLMEHRDLVLATKLYPHLKAQKKKMVCVVDDDAFIDLESNFELRQLARHSRVMMFYKPFNVHDLIYECLETK